MNTWFKIKFHSLKMLRLLWYGARYSVNKWKTIDGIHVPVYLNYGYSVLRFIDNGEYEICEISIIKKTLSRQDTVLELGTGIGFVSAYCAKQIGSSRVFTYEGNPSLAPLIKELYNKNKVSPQAHTALLGTANGTKIFYKNKSSFLASSAGAIGGKGHTTFTVEEKNLNEEILRLQPTYLVMDIEGGEYDIFKIIDFQSITKIQFELHPAVLNQQQVDFIFEKLKQEKFVRSTAFNFSHNFYFIKEDSK